LLLYINQKKLPSNCYSIVISLLSFLQPRSMAAPKGSLGKKSGRSALGAPSQHTQSSRKGKRSWRKHVNIEDVEEGLEGIRAEERVTGYIPYIMLLSIRGSNPCSRVALQKTQDSDLFEIDLKGDVNSTFLPVHENT